LTSQLKEKIDPYQLHNLDIKNYLADFRKGFQVESIGKAPLFLDHKSKNIHYKYTLS
jgi:hypothetical protein